ncbi:MAG: glucosaminidase domain-containing protein, partial [Pseudomonadota bacterium]
ASEQPADALREVAQEFEALFVEMMLKAARDANFGEGLFGSSQMQQYRELLDQQLALEMSQGRQFGIGDAILKQLERWQVPTPNSRVAAQPPLGGASEAANRLPSVERFKQQMMGPAERAAAKLGVSPELLVAQAALETGWGAHVIPTNDGRSSHNYFGIKAGASWQGAVARTTTSEFLEGREVVVEATFRAYGSPEEAFADYAKFIADNPRYQSALSATNAEQYMHAIADAGYATDPHYADKVLRVLESSRAITRVAP